MKRLELMQLHWDLCGEGRDIFMSKNDDYTGKSGDVFFNLRHFGAHGVLVRLSDKFARLESFIKTGSLNHEGVRATVVDAINYLVLFEGMVIDDADGSRSHSRGNTLAGGPRPAYAQPGPLPRDYVRGDWRGGAGGGGTGPGAEAVPAPGPDRRELESRTGAGDRRGKPVGGKSGRRKGAR